MPAGEALTAAQQASLNRLLQDAQAETGLEFSVRVGPLPDGRSTAVASHAALPRADRAVLVAVDPTSRYVEIVCGVLVPPQLTDGPVGVAAATMASTFPVGGLATGLRAGLAILRDHGVPDRIQHRK